MVNGRQFRPEELLDFIELPQFTRRWASLGLDDDEDLTALQCLIMAIPKGGKVIKGTAGIRKLRFAPPRWRRGKSGAARVLYLYLEDFGIVVLCLEYGKGEVDTISGAAKNYLNGKVDELVRELHRRRFLK